MVGHAATPAHLQVQPSCSHEQCSEFAESARRHVKRGTTPNGRPRNLREYQAHKLEDTVAVARHKGSAHPGSKSCALRAACSCPLLLLLLPRRRRQVQFQPKINEWRGSTLCCPVCSRVAATPVQAPACIQSQQLCAHHPQPPLAPHPTAVQGQRTAAI